MGYRFLKYTEMTPAKWSTIPDAPNQRDTLRHSKRARKKHLSRTTATHEHVVMAVFPNGERCKIDGHTRDFNWSNGFAEAPAMLRVEIFECDTLEDAYALYDCFDNKDAAEDAVDKASGAERALDLQFESELLRSRRYTSALNGAYAFLFGWKRNPPLRDMLSYFRPELVLIDSLAPTKRMYSALLTAAIITACRDGTSASPFWNAFIKNLGWKENGHQDPVQALTFKADQMKAARRLHGHSNVGELFASALSAYEADRFHEHYLANRGPRPLAGKSLERWQRDCLKVKELQARKDASKDGEGDH